MIKIMPVGIPLAKAGGFVCPENKWTAVPSQIAAVLMDKYPGKLYVVNTSSGQTVAKPDDVNAAVDVAPAPAPAPVVVDNNIAAEVDVVPVIGVTKAAAPVEPATPNANEVDIAPVDITAAVTPAESQVTDDLPLADRLRKVAPQLTDDDIMALEAAPVDTWTIDYVRKVTNVKNKVAKLILDAAMGV